MPGLREIPPRRLQPGDDRDETLRYLTSCSWSARRTRVLPYRILTMPCWKCPARRRTCFSMATRVILTEADRLADPHCLQQVFINLLRNAMDAGSTGVRICILARTCSAADAALPADAQVPGESDCNLSAEQGCAGILVDETVPAYRPGSCRRCSIRSSPPGNPARACDRAGTSSRKSSWNTAAALPSACSPPGSRASASACPKERQT